MIDRQHALDELLVALRQAAWIAVDTEADSLHSYPEKLCLLQLSFPGRDVLVDPLAGLDMQPLLQVLATQTLVLHGADYDLRLLQRSYRFLPRAVFDTMLAARLLGHAQLGLDALARALLDVQLEKGAQKANWSRRPLTERMVRYALNDTRYLKPIADALGAALRQAGRLAWHEEACQRLLADVARPRAIDPDAIWRVQGSSRLDRRALAVLRRLWHWREGEALRLARPPYFILPHETLVELANAAARSQPYELLLSQRLSHSGRRGLTHAVQTALAEPAAEWPRPTRQTGLRLTRMQKRRYEELRRQRDRQAARLGLEPSVIASRSALIALAGEAGGDSAGLMRWQLELLR